MNYRCLHCNAPNRPDARFCLGCGEPLDAATLLAGPDSGAPRPGWGWSGPRSVEALIGAILVIGLVILVVAGAWQDAHDHQEAIYRRALADLAAHQWDAAIRELRIVGSYADAPRRLQETTALWTQLQGLDAAAQRGEQAGDGWAALDSLRRLAALDPRFPGITARLANAQQQVGVLIYRVARGAQAGIWWALADGTHPQRLPDAAHPGLTIYGLSPDGRWAVYTVRPTPPDPVSTPHLNILDLPSGALTTLPLPVAARLDPQPVHFRNDGRGFWWVADGRWSYYDGATRQMTPIRGQVLAADPQYGRVIQANFGPFGGALDWSSLLLLTDAVGGHPQKLFGLPGSVSSGRISPDGRLLLYQAHTRQFDQVVDQLWALWLPVPAAAQGLPAGAILDSARALPGAPPPVLTSAFLPHGPDGAPGALLTWGGGPLRQVTPALTQNLNVDLSALRLGAHLRFTGLLADTASRLEAVRVREPSGQSLDWLGAISAPPAILYRGPAGGGQLGLFLAPVGGTPPASAADPPAPRRLLARPDDPAAWTHSTALSHDGTRLLAILPPGDAPGPAGLWAIPLDGTRPRLVMPDAVEFWTPDGWLGSP